MPVSATIGLLEAEAEAETVIKRYGFAALPVCPFTIAQKVEIVVEPKDSDEAGVSGFLMRVGNVFGIQYGAPHPQRGIHPVHRRARAGALLLAWACRTSVPQREWHSPLAQRVYFS